MMDDAHGSGSTHVHAHAHAHVHDDSHHMCKIGRMNDQHKIIQEYDKWAATYDEVISFVIVICNFIYFYFIY